PVAALGLAAGAADGTPAAFSATGTTVASIETFSPGHAIQISDGLHRQVSKILRVNAVTGAIEWFPAIAGPGDFDLTKTQISVLQFRLTVASGGADASNVVETFDALSMETDAPQYAPSVINNEISGSQFITVRDLHSAAGLGRTLPQPVAFTRLEGGRD